MSPANMPVKLVLPVYEVRRLDKMHFYGRFSFLHLVICTATILKHHLHKTSCGISLGIFDHAGHVFKKRRKTKKCNKERNSSQFKYQ